MVNLNSKNPPLAKYLPIFIILLIAGHFPAFATIDSLEQRLSVLPENEERIDVLNRLSYLYHRKEVQKTYDYANESLVLADNIKYIKGRAWALHNLSIANVISGDSDVAKKLNQEVIHLADSLQAFDLLITALNVQAYNYAKGGKPEKATESFQKALDIALQQDDKVGFSAIALNLGEIHADNGNFEKARVYYKDALEMATASGAIAKLAWANRLIAETFMAEKNYEEATNYLKKSIDGATSAQDLRSIAFAKSRLAKVYLETGRLKIAQQQVLESIELIKSVGDKEGLADGYIVLMDVYIKQNQPGKAVKFGKQAVQLMDEIDNLQLKVEVQDLLTKAYGNMQDFKTAYQLSLVNQILKDSLDYRNRMNQATELEEKYQSRKKESENKLLRAEQLHQSEVIAKQQSTNFYLTLVAFLSALLGYVAFRAYRSKQKNNLLLEQKVEERTVELQKTNAELITSNQELARFAYVASHDLREPLQNITNFTSLLKKKSPHDQDAEKTEIVEIIHKNARHMNRLIIDTLEFTRLNHTKTANEGVDLNETLKNIESAIATTLQKRNAVVKVAEPLPTVQANDSLLFAVFKNLIENGIKYNEAIQPTILIDHEERADNFLFSVKDNGIGIDQEYHETVFAMFKRLQNREKYEGSGMGLSNCKKIVTKLGGKIWVVSDGKSGSTFYFTIPKGQIKQQKETEQLLEIA